MNSLDKQYQDLLQSILDYGVEKKDRTGTGTKSIFGYTIRHNMSEGFPLLTTKKMAWKTMVTELLWFLRGDTNIKYLVDNGCHIWTGDALKNYNKNFKEYWNGKYGELSEKEFEKRILEDDEFAKKWGELGPIYGKQWRSWQDDFGPNKLPLFSPNNKIDQIQNLINDLKTNPDSRRLMVSAWNVGELDQMVLPPCHYGFQVYTRELSLFERWEYHFKNPYDGNLLSVMNAWDYLDDLNVPTRTISLMWNQRSVDTFLGLPFNIASYGLLLTILAKEVNMFPDQLIGNLGDTHLYLNHTEQAREQIGRDLTDEERYNIWFDNNYETGMERNFDPNNLPNFDDEYYIPTPKRTREPFKLPTLNQFPTYSGTRPSIESYVVSDFTLKDYQSHPSIKAPLSN